MLPTAAKEPATATAAPPPRAKRVRDVRDEEEEEETVTVRSSFEGASPAPLPGQPPPSGGKSVPSAKVGKPKKGGAGKKR